MEWEKAFASGASQTGLTSQLHPKEPYLQVYFIWTQGIRVPMKNFGDTSQPIQMTDAQYMYHFWV